MEGTIRSIADELLEAVATIGRAEARKVQLVADLVDVSCTVAPGVLAGGERLVATGGDGTPEVAEFLIVDLAAMLKIGSGSAWALIRDVLNLRHRHPRLWAAVGRGEVEVWQARKVAARCAGAGLSRQAADVVDRRLESAWGRLPWQRLLRRTEGLIVAADTALAAERAAQRKADRFVAIHHDGDGSSTLVARMDTADAVVLKNASIPSPTPWSSRADPNRCRSYVPLPWANSPGPPTAAPCADRTPPWLSTCPAKPSVAAVSRALRWFGRTPSDRCSWIRCENCWGTTESVSCRCST